MKSQTTHSFWQHFANLPLFIQNQARIKYILWRNNPNHPSLHFKAIKRDSTLFSAVLVWVIVPWDSLKMTSLLGFG